MQTNAEKLEFEFDNSAGKLVSSLQYMLDHITASMPANADSDDVLFRSKIIITELLTNGIKHAGSGNTTFDIEIDNKKMIICKKDYGMPLYLVTTRNNSAHNSENKKLISGDMLNSLYAIWESENQIRFASEECSIDDMLPIEQVMEHFGILIITRSSDEFTYTYNKDSRSNIFKVRISF